MESEHRSCGARADKSTSVLGARLRDWRSRKGYPLKRVAHDLGVSVSVVSQWERGERFPSADNLEALGDYTGIPLCAFVSACEMTCVDDTCPNT
jgi:transcriptional regulator with XRE-family HTH domain